MFGGFFGVFFLLDLWMVVLSFLLFSMGGGFCFGGLVAVLLFLLGLVVLGALVFFVFSGYFVFIVGVFLFGLLCVFWWFVCFSVWRCLGGWLFLVFFWVGFLWGVLE